MQVDAQERMTLICRIETVQHLICGGGLRAPNDLPPDCTNFMGERVIGHRVAQFDVKLSDLAAPTRMIEVGNMGARLRRRGTDFIYEAPPVPYTDGAGDAQEGGSCTVLPLHARKSGDKSTIR